MVRSEKVWHVGSSICHCVSDAVFRFCLSCFVCSPPRNFSDPKNPGLKCLAHGVLRQRTEARHGEYSQTRKHVRQLDEQRSKGNTSGALDYCGSSRACRSPAGVDNWYTFFAPSVSVVLEKTGIIESYVQSGLQGRADDPFPDFLSSIHPALRPKYGMQGSRQVGTCRHVASQVRVTQGKSSQAVSTHHQPSTINKQEPR